MALLITLNASMKNQLFSHEGVDEVIYKIPENGGEYTVGFTVFLVAANVDSVGVEPDSEDVSLPTFTPILTNPNDIGVLTNVDGANSWRFTIASPSTFTGANEELLQGDRILTDSDLPWQALDPNGVNRNVPLLAQRLGSEFYIFNDGTSGNLIVEESGIEATVRPGMLLHCKRLTTKWIGFLYAS